MAAIPLVLHLLERAPEPRVRFAAVKLLKNAPVEVTRKRSLRELLLLALRIAALVLLAAAFARPFLASGAALADRAATIVAIDTSYSLDAPGRIERAKELAKGAVARAAATDLVGVVTFSDEAEVRLKPSVDRRLAVAAIDRVRPGFGATRYRTGLAAAADSLGGRRGTIVVVTDLQEIGFDAGERAEVPETARLEIADVGALPPNLAVTAARQAGDRLIATIRNSGSDSRETRVLLSIDGRMAGESAVRIGPRQASDVTFEKIGRGSEARVTLEDPRGLQADNTRYAMLGAATGPVVFLVTDTGDAVREAFYLQQALASGGLYEIAGIAASALNNWTADRLRSAAAVILLSTRSLERRGRQVLAAYVGSGGGLMLAVGPDVDGDVASGVLGGEHPIRIRKPEARAEPRTWAAVDPRHPVMRPLGAQAAPLGVVTFQTIAGISAAGCQVVARFTTGEMALVDCAVGDGRGLLLASDLDRRWNDFPLHSAFVPFVTGAVRYLAAGRGDRAEYLVADAPAGVPPAPGFGTLSPPPGSQSVVPRRIAVNVDPREADPARLSREDFLSVVARLKDAGVAGAEVDARQQEDRQHLWQYLLGIMIVTLAIEGIVASRTS